MFRVLGIVCALAVVAGAANADNDRSAFSRTQLHVTEQLNAVIAAGVAHKTSQLPPQLGAPEIREEKLAAAEQRLH